MKAIELKPREFHRRTAWAMKTARRGVPVVIVSADEPPLTLQVGRPEELTKAKVDWDAHFAWLKKQPVLDTNPVDELRAAEGR
jgi:hypothetical protein